MSKTLGDTRLDSSKHRNTSAPIGEPSTLGNRRVIQVQQNATSTLVLELGQIAALQRLDIGRITPAGAAWRLDAIKKIGHVRLDDETELVIKPKVPIHNILGMLVASEGESVWQDGEISVASDTPIAEALAALLIHTAKKALRKGIRRDYLERSDVATTIRGRWDIAAQIRNRQGTPLPVEIVHDDYTVDIAENRILATAVHIARKQGMFASDSRITRDALRIEQMLSDAQLLRWGSPLPRVRWTRLNEHYRLSVRIATVLLESSGWHNERIGVTGVGFLLDMAQTFEAYVTRKMEVFGRAEGVAVIGQLTDHLGITMPGAIEIRYDIVLKKGSAVLAVADAKYKIIEGNKGDKAWGVRNADVYQMIAYMHALGLRDAHLIYVETDKAASSQASTFDQPRVLVVPGYGAPIFSGPITGSEAAESALNARVSGTEVRNSAHISNDLSIHIHTLNLSLPLPQLDEQIKAILEAMVQ